MCKETKQGARTPGSRQAPLPEDTRLPAGASPSTSLVRSQGTTYSTAGLQTPRPGRRQDGAAFLVSRKRVLGEMEELWSSQKLVAKARPSAGKPRGPPPPTQHTGGPFKR